MAEQKGVRAALRERLAEKLHDATGLIAGDVLIYEDCLALADEILNGTQIDVANWCDFHEGRPAECPQDDMDQCEKETWTYVAIPPEVFTPPAGESTPEVSE